MLHCKVPTHCQHLQNLKPKKKPKQTVLYFYYYYQAASQIKPAIQFEKGFISMFILFNFMVRNRTYETGEMYK